MKLRIGPSTYRVEITPGALYRDGIERGAVMHDRTILLSGAADVRDRLEMLFDQARMLWAGHFGPIYPEGIAGFLVTMTRQLRKQGGEKALRRMVAPCFTREAA